MLLMTASILSYSTALDSAPVSRNLSAHFTSSYSLRAAKLLYWAYSFLNLAISGIWTNLINLC